MLPTTGVAKYDCLARDFPEEVAAFLQKVEDNKWLVKKTTKLPKGTRALFFPRKGRSYYNPETFTFLDLLHEEKHVEFFLQRGNWKLRGGQLERDEIAAYEFERELGKREGFCAEYMEYLEKQIDFYTERLASGASGRRPAIMPDPFMKREDPDR